MNSYEYDATKTNMKYFDLQNISVIGIPIEKLFFINLHKHSAFSSNVTLQTSSET